MACPSCRASNPADARFCGSCGVALLAARCPSCDQPLLAGVRFCRSCGGAVAPLLAGRYSILGRLGEGGRKRVYLCRDTRLERDVAVALVKPEAYGSEGVDRARREARALARLGDHPAIVTLFDIVEDDGQLHLVSEHLTGGSVEELLAAKEGERLPLTEILSIASDVASALAHAHARGVIHRDVKPGNVWLTAAGRAKLGDFGLALDLDRTRLTTDGTILGTASYIAPEQALGEPVDARSDLYALGALLYELIAGRPPFVAGDAVSLISQHLQAEPVAPGWYNHNVPSALEQLVLSLLAKRPSDRPSTAEEVMARLQEIAAGPVSPSQRGPTSRPDSLAAGVFVGRRAERDLLWALLDDALAGAGRLALIAGEPGIGKSRLADETATVARIRGATVLVGRCHEGEGAPAYWPWIQLIRAYTADRRPADLQKVLGPAASDIARLVPEVAALLEELDATGTTPSLSPEQERFRLFDGVTTFLRSAASRTPLVLVLDDLHWADHSSLLLLQFLAPRLARSQILMVGTYRETDLRRDHPLTRVLSDIGRERHCHRVLLRGLEADDVARYVELASGTTPSSAVAGAIWRQTEGNPFFVSEIVRLLVGEGQAERLTSGDGTPWAVPQGVREVIGRRLDGLSPAANTLLAAASVIGRDIDGRILEQVDGLDEAERSAAMDEAVAARVLLETPDGPGQYRFAHALVRETLYDELRTSQRVQLHRRVAEAYELVHQHDIDDHLPAVAHHHLEAVAGGDVGVAVGWAVRAARRALALLAFDEAVALLKRALQGLDLVRSPEGETGAAFDEVELLLALGDAATRAGQAATAQQAFERASDRARASGQVEYLARAALGLAGGDVPLTYASPVGSPSVPLLEEALQALGSEDSPTRVGLLARLATSVDEADLLDRGRRLADDAVSMAERLNDDRALLTAMSARYWVALGPERLSDRIEALPELLHLARRSGDREMELLARTFAFINSLEMGELAWADAELDAAVALSDSLHQPLFEWQVKTMLSARALLVGRLDESRQLADEAWATGHRPAGSQADVAFGAHLLVSGWLQGRLRETRQLVSSTGADLLSEASFHATMAFVESQLDDHLAARRHLAELPPSRLAAHPRNGNFLGLLHDVGWAAATGGDGERTRAVAELLGPFAGRFIVAAGTGGVCFGPVDTLLGVLASVGGEPERAKAWFESARVLAARMGAVPFLAVALKEQAVNGLRHGLDVTETLGYITEALAAARACRLDGVVAELTSMRGALVGRSGSASASGERSLAAMADAPVTILVTDIEGSTAITERLGDRKAQHLMRAHHRIVRDVVLDHRGQEVRAEGDGFMIAFRLAANGLACAVELQRRFEKLGADTSAPTLRVRSALHTGNVVSSDDDLFGRDVIVAAHIAGLASGGEILISDATRGLLPSGSGLPPFGPSRTVELADLGQRVRVATVEWKDTDEQPDLQV